MNKKLIKTIASVTCGLGIVGSVPFMTTSCGSSTSNPTRLLIDESAIIEDIKGVTLSPITSSIPLDQSVYYNNPAKKKVTNGLTFMLDGPDLPDGLSFDSNNGIISGTPEQRFSGKFVIRVSKKNDNKTTLYGETNEFSINIERTDKFVPDPSISDFETDSNKIINITNNGKTSIATYKSQGYDAIKIPNDSSIDTYAIKDDNWTNELDFIKTIELPENITNVSDYVNSTQVNIFPNTIEKIIFDASTISFTPNDTTGGGNAFMFGNATKVNTIEFKNLTSPDEINFINSDRSKDFISEFFKNLGSQATGPKIIKFTAPNLSLAVKGEIFQKIVLKGELNQDWRYNYYD